MGRYSLAERQMFDPEGSEKSPAPSGRRQGALALVGAWLEVDEQELDSLIEYIYAGRHQDLGRRVELGA